MHTYNTIQRIALLFLLSIAVALPASAQNIDLQQTVLSADFSDEVVLSDELNPVESLEQLISDVKRLEDIPTVAPELSRVEWDAYGDRLEAALDTDHRGLNHAALRLVIAYGDHIKLDQDAVFDVMRIYRDDDSERARRMAVVALSEMESEWALEFLERSVRFEKSSTIKQTILAVLAANKNSSTPL